jgi:hypothetical protein
MIEKLKFVGAITFVLVAYGVVGHLDEENERLETERYCQMRQIWEQNKDVLPVKRPGWPNFKPEIVCGV